MKNPLLLSDLLLTPLAPDLKLGRILSINENYDQSPQPMALAKSDSAAGTSFDMGTQKVSVTTYISWELN